MEQIIRPKAKRIDSANEAVRQAFLRGEVLTDAIARRKYGCGRISHIVGDERPVGWKIHDNWITVTTRWKRKTRVKEYRLIGVERGK